MKLIFESWKKYLLKEEIVFDSVDGLGATPNNADIDYFGFIVWMRPLDFLKLNPGRREDTEHFKALRDYILNQEQIRLGPPSLNCHWDEEKETWQVEGHEGRGRMIVLHGLQPNDQVPVHVFPRGMRARHITEKMARSIIMPDREAASGALFVPKKVVLGGKEI
jgi:hypothetical protein